jgi:hypothetical protein
LRPGWQLSDHGTDQTRSNSHPQRREQKGQGGEEGKRHGDLLPVRVRALLVGLVPGGGVVLARPDLKWNPKGRFVITLQADEAKDLGTLEVPAGSIGT